MVGLRAMKLVRGFYNEEVELVVFQLFEQKKGVSGKLILIIFIIPLMVVTASLYIGLIYPFYLVA